jgi:crossover junction endodeoxyribonuclease RusA
MISFTLPISPSINHYFARRGKFTYLPAEVKAYRQEVADIVASAGHPTLEGRLSVYMAVHMPSKRRSDLDNRCKGSLDALTHAGAWLDDEQIDCLVVVRREVIKGGLMKVVICPVDGPIETSAIQGIHHGKEIR